MDFAPSQAEVIFAATLQRAFADLTGGAVAHDSVERTLNALGLTDADLAAADAQGVLRMAHTVAFEAGRAALPYPVLETLVASIVRTGIAGLGGTLALAAADCIVAASPPARHVGRAALREGRLDGSLGLVAFPERAAYVMAVVRDADSETNVVVLVDARQAGARIRPRRSVEVTYPVGELLADGLRPGDVQVAVSLDRGGAAAECFELAAAVLAAAEICGAASAALELTKRYLEMRVQFGRPLSANQALRHVMAAAHVRVEAMAAAVRYAALAIDAGAGDAEIAARAAKHYASVEGKALAEDMLQLHGAIGFTAEYDLARFLCRILRLAAMHGSPRREAERLLDLVAIEGGGRD